MMQIGRNLLNIILAVLLIFSYAHFTSLIQTSFAISNPITTWNTSSSALPYPLASHISTSVEDKLFIIGGATVDDYSQILSSTKDITGSISTWNTISNFPETRYWSAFAKTGNQVYVIAGSNFNGTSHFTNDIAFSTIQPNGDFSTWQTLNPLPKNLSLGAATISGNRLYYAGGFNSSETNQNVYTAPINQDGTIGTWTTAGLLPKPLFGFGMIEYNGKLIIAGGLDPNGFSANTYTTSLNPDGTLGGWTESTSLPEPVYRGSFVTNGSTLISIGGSNGTTALDNIYYTSIKNDGTLNTWQSSSHKLPQPVSAASATVANNYIYLTGGYNGNEYIDTVYYTKFNTGEEINVPLIKQSDPLWGSNEYDSAIKWSPTSPTISSWGCAMTSAVMDFSISWNN